MTKLKLGMLSKADTVEGQGVGSAYKELMRLLATYGKDDFSLVVNKKVGDCDVLHAHTVNFGSFFKMKFSHKPSVISVHFTPDMADNSINLPKLFVKVFDWYLLRVYKAADVVHVVNPDLKKELLRYGFKPENIYYIPNFVAKSQFYPKSAAEKAELRKKYGYKDSDFIAFACGQTRAGKGVQDFVATAKLVPEIKFIWAGGFSFGPLADGYGDTKDMLKNLPENVKFPGIVPRDEINDLLNLCDVFFFPSYQELFPMSILEAASTHTPLLLRDIPEYRDILTGRYMMKTNNEDFAAALRALKNDSALYEEWKQKAADVAQQYSEERIYQIWKQFYADRASTGRKQK